MRARAVALPAVALLLAGCAQQPNDPATCLPSVLQSGPLPAPYDATPATTRPWIRGAGFLAILDYASDRTSDLVPGTRMPDGTTSRVEIRVPGVAGGAATGDLSVTGTSKGRTFDQMIANAAPTSYAGELDVPATGCWRLRLTAGGQDLGSLSVRVIDPPA